MKHQTNTPKLIYQTLMDDMNRERFAVHGSAFTISNKTILLIGPSGVGKSTLRNYLIHAFGGLVIQDDKPQLLMIDGVLSVTGNPYVSDNCLSYSDSIFTLDALYILKKSDDFYVRENTMDVVALWSRFGIGMPDDTAALEMVLKKIRDFQVFEVGILHNDISLIRFKEMMLKKILIKN